ncbi:MAG: TolC family protein [Bacteroidota bacterium]
MYKPLIILWSLLAIWELNAQTSLPEYIEKGLSQNSGFQQASLVTSAAAAAQQAATAQGSIRLDFQPSYTVAAGGRTIDIPIGDIVNPVYSTLNTLTGSEQFPQLDNVSELLNPNNFYDVKVRATYPVLNKAIGINEDIKTLQTELARDGEELARQRLVADISVAYYDCQMALRAIDVYRDAQVLIQENIRVNRSLVKRGAGLPTSVLAAESDSVLVAAELVNAQLRAEAAAARLNVLTNQSMTAPVAKDETITTLPRMAASINAARPELAQLNRLLAINQKQVELAQSGGKPQLNVFADVGAQGFDFQIDGQAPYVLAGVSLNLNLFDGGQRKASVQEAQLRQAATEAQRTYLVQQLSLEAFAAWQTCTASINTYTALTTDVNIKQRQYQDQLGRYRAGTVNYIAVQEARNAWTQAQLAQNIAFFQTWKDWVMWERAAGAEG